MSFNDNHAYSNRHHFSFNFNPGLKQYHSQLPSLVDRDYRRDTKRPRWNFDFPQLDPRAGGSGGLLAYDSDKQRTSTGHHISLPPHHRHPPSSVQIKMEPTHDNSLLALTGVNQSSLPLHHSLPSHHMNPAHHPSQHTHMLLSNIRHAHDVSPDRLSLDGPERSYAGGHGQRDADMDVLDTMDPDHLGLDQMDGGEEYDYDYDEDDGLGNLDLTPGSSSAQPHQHGLASGSGSGLHTLHPGSASATGSRVRFNGDDSSNSMLPRSIGSGNGSAKSAAAAARAKDREGDRLIRRRSSKACDQCRKSKCKCERSIVEGEPCKSCIALGTACTFLGPSRKRGPPKGYIDAIESRLHQTEAVLGIILSLARDGDDRANELINDLCDTDEIARLIIDRVENGVYGSKRRAKPSSSGSGGSGGEGGPLQGRGRMVGLGTEDGGILSHHPSNEWQDRVTEKLKVTVTSRQSHGLSASPITPAKSTSPAFPRAPALQSSSSAPGQIFPVQTLDPHMIHDPLAAGSKPSLSIFPSGVNQTGGPVSAGPVPTMGMGVGNVSGPLSASVLDESQRQTQRRRMSRAGESEGPSDLTESGNHTAASLEFSRSMSTERRWSRDDETNGARRTRVSLSPAHARTSGATTTGTPQFGYPIRGLNNNNMDYRSSSGVLELDGDRELDPENQHARGRLERLDADGGVSSNGVARLHAQSRSPTSHAHTNSHSQSLGPERERLSESDDADGEELTDAVGQLSLNEDAQVRYHSKISGLHLLVQGPMGSKPRQDGRNEGGLWRFPKARLWPPIAPNKNGSPLAVHLDEVESDLERLPEPAVQKKLISLYFTYVHPYLPIVHKDTFLEDFKAGFRNSSGDSPEVAQQSESEKETSQSAEDIAKASLSKPKGNAKGNGRVPTLLLLAMFAIAARYTSEEEELPPSGQMWPAGDTFLEGAKIILDRTYASTRPSTCQALLLMAYREIGIGAMAQSWLYTGMAIRMAHDLGLHRSADEWRIKGDLLFSPVDQQVRKRIWYACVIMDKYVSAYIGRPLSIFEHDYDTRLPSLEESEETELWRPDRKEPLALQAGDGEQPAESLFKPVQSHVISCFNHSATLSCLLSVIMQKLYPVQPNPERQVDAQRFDKMLDKWYIDLPDHLRYESASKSPVPPPHVLTLHMQYWCVVLLLHRPFIRHHVAMSQRKNNGVLDSPSEGDIYSTSKQNYDLCVMAANHITSIVSAYLEIFCPRRSPVFLSYYIFTAGITHLTTIASSPDDPQARIGLTKCLDALKRMQIAWPSAERAWQLLNGARDNAMGPIEPQRLPLSLSRRNKRSAEEPIESIPEGMGEAVLKDPRFTQDLLAAGSVSNTFSPGTDLQFSNGDASLNFFNTFDHDRWISDGTMAAFPTELSTSVLPQQYSTGLVDDRLVRAASQQSAQQSVDGEASHSSMIEQGSHGRYHHYWGDFSSLGTAPSMMNPVYAAPQLMSTDVTNPATSQVHLQQRGPPSVQHHSQQSQYMGNQYNIFNTMSNS